MHGQIFMKELSGFLMISLAACKIVMVDPCVE